jgi:hypothetical protein
MNELDVASSGFDSSLLFVSSEGLSSGSQTLGEAAIELLEPVLSEEHFP